MLIPDLDRDLTSVALRQPFPPHLGRSAGRLVFGRVQAGELKTLVIGSKTRALADVKVVAGQAVQLRLFPYVPTPCPRRTKPQ